MEEMTHPKFAVVGHPNKGKSAIVSSLALDDSVQISDTPGTTTVKRSFPLKVDGKVIYELFDTPGFQRARRALEWLEGHDVSADKKYEVVNAFIHTFKEDPKFNDEIELLEPIMEGAGIIYVVDASKPYGEEYEAEMEILRWTGQPSMALINHIDEDDYTAEWKRALGHYFKIVRTYNPMDVSLEQHLSILESMAQLKEEWTAPVKASMDFFQHYYDAMLHQSSEAISQALQSAISLTETLYFESDNATEAQKKQLETHYKNSLRAIESDTQKSIESIWKHEHLEKNQNPLSFDDMDLFSEASASLFGLTRKELLMTGVSSGAVTGAGIDLLFAGHTFFLGGAIGAVAGGVGAYFAFNELSEIKVFGKTLGSKYLEIGPMENRNFPYILLGRLLYHTSVIAKRSHAKRDKVVFEMQSSFKEKWLDDSLKKELEKYHKKFRSGKAVDAEEMKVYDTLIYGTLQKLL